MGLAILDFFIQITMTVGIVFIFGFCMWFCNKLFYRNLGGVGKSVSYATGFLGTPIHELCHVVFCLFFGHKIVEVKLFQIDSKDGTLGYVRHTYNTRSIYQCVGNFFIGIAPIIGMCAVMAVIANALLPSTANAISFVVSADSAAGFFDALGNMIVVFFMSASGWRWWIFALIAVLLSLHMTLSRADIKGALSGLLALITIVFILDIIFGAVGDYLLGKFTGLCISAGCWLICFFVFAMIFAVAEVGISFIIRACVRRFR